MIGCVGKFFYFLFFFCPKVFLLILRGNGPRGWTKIFFIRYHGFICKLFCGGAKNKYFKEILKFIYIYIERERERERWWPCPFYIMHKKIKL